MHTLVHLNAVLLLTVTVTGLRAITLDAAVSQALAHNKTIKMAASRSEQRKQELSAQQTRRLPVTAVTAVAGLSVTRADVTFPQGALGDFAATGPIPANDMRLGIPRQITGFSYSQVALPLTQQIRIGAGIENARLELGLAGTERARTEQEVTAQVRQLYFGLLSADAALRASEANLKLALEVERLAGQGVDAGVTLPADKGEAVARRVRAQAALSGVRAERENLRERFNVLLGRSLDEPAEVAQPAIPAVEEDPQQLAEKAATSRPEIEAARLRIRQAETAVRAKKSELIPDVSLVFQHFGFFNTGNLAPRNYAVAGLQVTVEPWDWGRRRKETRALEHQAAGARLALEDTAQQVRLQARQAWRAWQQSQFDLAAAEAAVAAAQESVRVNKQRYEQQAALLRALLEAQSNFESAQEQQVRAIAARGSAWASVQLAVGSN